MLKAAGLEYEAVGDGEPVLLIHGGHIADAFLPLTREATLADHYRLIRYRRRGYVGSDPVSGAFSIEQQARDAQALLTKLGVERAHVVGHSYGGAIAVQLATLAPRLVHSLVVLEPAILPPEISAAFFEQAEPIFAAYRSGDVANAIDLFMASVSAADWRSAVAEPLPGAAEQAEKDAATSFEVEIPALAEGILGGDRASNIAQPVLYLLGSESGPLFDAAMLHFQALVPQVEQVVVPGVNHLMQIRNPKLVAEPIADFLARNPLH
jgi:pimeloyl-ACP methyl ester carboxylesterase